MAGLVDWAANQAGAPLDLNSAASPPAAVLAGDRRTGTVVGAVVGAVDGVLAGFLIGAVAGRLDGVLAGFLVGIVVAVTNALRVLGMANLRDSPDVGLPCASACPGRSLAPCRCHRRGVLRQAGAVYQLRHIGLQHRLANRDAAKEH